MCMASTRAHAGWFTRCCVELPSTNPTNTVQKQYKNRPTTVHKPYTNRPKTGTTIPHDRLHKNAAAPAPAGYRPDYALIRALRESRSQNEKYPLDPKGGADATPRHTALRRGGGGQRPTRRAAPTPTGPQGRRRCHPSPHCAMARRGRPEAYPKGRPNPAQDPKGGAGASSRHPAPRRDESARRPTRRAAPTVKEVTPRPLR